MKRQTKIVGPLAGKFARGIISRNATMASHCAGFMVDDLRRLHSALCEQKRSVKDRDLVLDQINRAVQLRDDITNFSKKYAPKTCTSKPSPTV